MAKDRTLLTTTQFAGLLGVERCQAWRILKSIRASKGIVRIGVRIHIERWFAEELAEKYRQAKNWLQTAD